MRILLCLWLLVLLPPLTASGAEKPVRFCIDPPHDRLCPVFPEDQREFEKGSLYLLLSSGSQDPFDEFAWQAFVALNFRALDAAAAPGWREFARREEVLAQDAGCAAQRAAAEVVAADFVQADGNVLIDRFGNPIVYETRVNQVAARYIRDNALASPEAQRAAAVIDFPRGMDAAAPASVFVKTAWRILPAPDPDYIAARGLVVVPPEASRTGRQLCLPVQLGLVGMHIVAKVASGNGAKWIWATFEHVRNAPDAANARDINSIFDNVLFPGGCKAPDDAAGFVLFDPKRAGEAANEPVREQILWAERPPFAASAGGTPLAPNQVVRCWKIFGPTRATNAMWRDRLRSTVLANYMLISAQWRGTTQTSFTENGELPRFLSNTTMETFLQADRAGTCLGCHATARTIAGEQSDFTFVLQRVAE